MEYDIYIDESGLFIETSTNTSERIQHHGEKRKFPSQLAGYVCAAGRLTDAIARNVIGRSLKIVGIEAEHGFHCSKFKSRNKNAFDLFVQAIVKEFANAKLQPIRIVNEEGVSYGDRIANYTNILAELLVRVCRQLQTGSTDGVELNVFAAKVHSRLSEIKHVWRSKIRWGTLTGLYRSTKPFNMYRNWWNEKHLG